MDPGILLDFDRARRVGLDEAILCSGKTTDQLIRILEQAAARSAPLLLTRLSPEQHSEITVRTSYAGELDFDQLSETAFFGDVSRRRKSMGEASVAIVSAGASDRRVAREAQRTLEYHGRASESFHDVGVAGLWRLTERLEELRGFPIVIVVAGMDGALPSVVGGLVGSLVVAVPTSTGYGAARGGETALFAALTSCAPGVVVVNIDNGYGAAAAAVRALNAGVARARD